MQKTISLKKKPNTNYIPSACLIFYLKEITEEENDIYDNNKNK
jgi:hypothetical protein